MSAIHGIAWGLVELDELNVNAHKFFRKAVRDELRSHNMRLVANGRRTFCLMGSSRRKDAMQRQPRKRICSGSFESCCKRASEIITPSNPAE
jgi:hypothetical protein